MRRVLAAVLPALLLLTACAGPVLVPEAGPNAPDFVRKSPPPAPRVELVTDAGERSPRAGGAVDSVVRHTDSFDVIGWAFLDTESPRGVLRLVLPASVDASVESVTNVPRPDVVNATGSKADILAGFTITVEGTLPDDAGVCILSRSSQGAFRLAGSDEDLCPA